MRSGGALNYICGVIFILRIEENINDFIIFKHFIQLTNGTKPFDCIRTDQFLDLRDKKNTNFQ